MRLLGLDPSTKTGFVALDLDGDILRAKELTGVGSQDPKRMRTMIENIMDHVNQDDFIVIEGFGFASQQAVQNGGIGWGIRMALDERGINYYEAAPNAVKKFVGVTDWKGEPGNKVRLKGKEKKKAVADAVLEHFGFDHKSDNVVDAFILARIARAIHLTQKGLDPYITSYQAEVVQQILSPEPKAKKKKVKVQ